MYSYEHYRNRKYPADPLEIVLPQFKLWSSILDFGDVIQLHHPGDDEFINTIHPDNYLYICVGNIFDGNLLCLNYHTEAHHRPIGKLWTTGPLLNKKRALHLGTDVLLAMDLINNRSD